MATREKRKERPPRRGSLKRVLSLALLTLSTLALLIMSALQLALSYHDEQQAVASRMELAAQRAVTSVTRQIDLKANELSSVNIVGLDALDPADYKSVLGRLLGEDRSFNQVAMWNLDGTEISRVCRGAQEGCRQSLPGLPADAVNDVRNGDVHFGAVTIEANSNEPLMVVAVPVLDAYKEPTAMLVGELRLKFMWDVLREIKNTEGADVFVVNGAGELIAHADPTRVLRRENVSNLREVAEYLRGEGDGKGGKEAEITTGLEGGRVVSSHLVLQNPNWAVIVEYPAATVYSTFLTVAIQTAVLAVVGVFFAVLAGLWLAGRITKPILRLRSAAEKMREGDLRVRVKDVPNNEIGELAETLNAMASRLKEVYDDLELKVEERTKELESHRVEFISVATHQLKTPITALRWNLDAIWENEGSLDEETRGEVADMRTIVGNMYDLVDALLNVSRLDLGTCAVIPEPVSLRDELTSVIGLLKTEIDRKKIAIGLDIDEAIPATYDADKQMLGIIAQNLLSNAVKYTPEGGKVNVTLKDDEKGIVFSVKDDGIGIPKEQQTRIFERMFRADNAATIQGTGLGLYIIKRITENIHGDIWFESVEGEGTTFTVVLPKDGMPAKAGTRRLSSSAATM